MGVLNVPPQTAAPAMLYKCVFALWMLSFESEGSVDFEEQAVIQKVREVLTYSRVEKVIRLTLTLLKNLLPHRSFAEQMVKLGVKERVMTLMGSNNPEHRDVRREALLCCQKIMLNKWQDVN